MDNTSKRQIQIYFCMTCETMCKKTKLLTLFVSKLQPNLCFATGIFLRCTKNKNSETTTTTKEAASRVVCVSSAETFCVIQTVCSSYCGVWKLSTNAGSFCVVTSTETGIIFIILKYKFNKMCRLSVERKQQIFLVTSTRFVARVLSSNLAFWVREICWGPRWTPEKSSVNFVWYPTGDSLKAKFQVRRISRLAENTCIAATCAGSAGRWAVMFGRLQCLRQLLAPSLACKLAFLSWPSSTPLWV